MPLAQQQQRANELLARALLDLVSQPGFDAPVELDRNDSWSVEL